MLKIMIDAGHGKGDNRGALHGDEGTNNYNYALILKKELEKYEGVQVGLTRKKLTDNPTVQKRGEAAKGYDLFVSEHTDALADKSVRGVTIIDSIQKPTGDLAKNVAARISAVMNTQNRGVRTKSLTNNKGRDWYGVLRNNGAKAGMLIEKGFHTNPQDSAFYYNNMETIAKAEANEIAKFYGKKAKTTATKPATPKPTPKPTTTNLYRVQTPVLTPTQADNTIQKLTRHKIESVKVQTTDGLRVQAGAFADKKKATAQVDRVNGLGFGFAINPEESTEVLYKVQTNALTKHLANKVTATLRANGLAFITLVVNNGHVVQIGAYGKLANAHKRVDTLRGLGVQTVIVTDTGEKITPKNRTTQVKEIATKIWTDPNHPYGDGAERRKTLGDLYTDVQKYIEKHFIK